MGEKGENMGALCLWVIFYALWGLYLLVHVSYCYSRDSWLRYLPKGLASNWFSFATVLVRTTGLDENN